VVSRLGDQKRGASNDAHLHDNYRIPRLRILLVLAFPLELRIASGQMTSGSAKYIRDLKVQTIHFDGGRGLQRLKENQKVDVHFPETRVSIFRL
jgi:hypothetical protein